MKNAIRVLMLVAVLLIGIALSFPEFRLPRVAAQGPALTGSYGFSGSSTVFAPASNTSPIAVVGVLRFDGAGNVTGSETVVQPDTTPNATNVQSFPLQLSGTYTLNADGTGTLNLTIQIPNSMPIGVTVSFVITDGGSGFLFVQTSGGNSLFAGSGRKQ